MLFKSKNKSSLDKLKDKYTYLMRKSYNTAIKDKQKSDVLNKKADLVLREIKRLETQS
ncbi:Lacal_2735 family protein [Croceibacter atlanticus]|uniref:Lacal_2735 family protein n=1 Tax=Croceibacter atlanticus TaxID=313588 RepID=UPI0030FBCCA7